MQLKVSSVVIKDFLVKLDDIHVTPFMFRMACMAFTFGDVMDLPVEIGLSFYVGIDLFMTITAKFILLASIKYLVAFFAFLLKTRMATHKLTRHHQVFHSLYWIDTSIAKRDREKKKNGRQN